LISTGKPIAAASACAAATSGTAPSEPGTQGTLSVFIVVLAAILSPMMAMCSGVGPMKASSCSSTMRAKAAFSDRKP